jgi:hypothetical protein
VRRLYEQGCSVVPLLSLFLDYRCLVVWHILKSEQKFPDFVANGIFYATEAERWLVDQPDEDNASPFFE